MMEQFDQTLFIQDEPIYEQPKSSFGDKEVPKSSRKNKPLFILISISAAVIFIIGLIITVLINSQVPTGPLVEPTPQSTPSIQQQRSHIDQLFFELDQDIKQADPLENILPYPPVETNISVSPTDE